jgi:hypothetical protein
LTLIVRPSSPAAPQTIPPARLFSVSVKHPSKKIEKRRLSALMAAKIGAKEIHPVKEEDKMSRNRLFYVVIVLALAILAVLTIRTAVASSSVVSVGYDSYAKVDRARTESHPGGASDLSDYWFRHRGELRLMNRPDLSDYALRHRDLIRQVTQPDQSDYALRHPELMHPAAADLSDWFQRHPESIHAASPGTSSD